VKPRRLLLAAAACGLLATATALLWRRGAASRGAAVPAPAAAHAAKSAAPVFTPAAVFERAFWRRPAAEDRILHAVRREEPAAGGAGIARWQWFIAVEPGAAMRDWLFKANPFELVAVPAGTSASTTPVALDAPPDWFPSAPALASFTHFRNREGRLHVFLDPRTHRLYATDSGGGFTVAQK
jgi:hypothetical protein